MRATFITDQGRVRANNEDRCLVREFADDTLLLAVADGMGGHAAGERAAQIAVDSLEACNPDVLMVKDHLIGLVHSAQRRVVEEAEQQAASRGMGTTLTVVLVKGGTAFWAHVGDSRLWLFRNGDLSEITEDHTIPGKLLKNGEIGKEEARLHPLRNILLSCIGCRDFRIDSGSLDVKQGDLLLLTTDGLHDAVSRKNILSVLSSDPALDAGLKALLRLALEAGGRDNITAVAVRI